MSQQSENPQQFEKPQQSEKPQQFEKVQHYNQGGFECIDVMKAISTPEEFKGFLRLNTFKYLYRANFKGVKVSDLKKAQYYLNRLVQEYEEQKDD